MSKDAQATGILNTQAGAIFHCGRKSVSVEITVQKRGTNSEIVVGGIGRNGMSLFSHRKLPASST